MSDHRLDRAPADTRFRKLSAIWLIVAVVLFALALAGCSTTPTGGSKGGSFCDVSRPIRIAPEAVDALTTEQAREALSHNRYGEKACGWKP